MLLDDPSGILVDYYLGVGEGPAQFQLYRVGNFMRLEQGQFRIHHQMELDETGRPRTPGAHLVQVLYMLMGQRDLANPSPLLVGQFAR